MHDAPKVRDTLDLFLLNQKNDYQAQLQREATAAALQHGLRLQVHDAAMRTDRQLEQILGLIRGPSRASALAILVHPVLDDMHQDAAREAVRAGIGWVLLNREADYVSDLRRLHPGVPVFCVTPDQEEIGRVQGRLVRSLLPSGGKVLCITGPFRSFSARQRRRGLEEAIHGSGLQMVCIAGDYSNRSGENAVRSWELRVDGSQSHPAFRSFFPDLVLAHNDAMADGARRALAEVGKRRGWPHVAAVPLVGCDGTTDFGIPLVDAGALAGTVIMPGTGASAINVLQDFRRSGRTPPSRVLLEVSAYPDLIAVKPIKIHA